MSPDSTLTARVKRSLRLAILNRLEADGIRKDRQQRLSEKLGLHQPDVSRLLSGKLDRFSVDVLLRTAEKLGAEFIYDPEAEAEALREYTKLLAQCRKAKSSAEVKTMNAVVKALRIMESPIIVHLKRKRKLDTLLVHLQKRPTPRQDLDWMTKQLENLIAEMR
jgi:predicted XRE-type DNA-binding protein